MQLTFVAFLFSRDSHESLGGFEKGVDATRVPTT